MPLKVWHAFKSVIYHQKLWHSFKGNQFYICSFVWKSQVTLVCSSYLRHTGIKGMNHSRMTSSQTQKDPKITGLLTHWRLNSLDSEWYLWHPSLKPSNRRYLLRDYLNKSPCLMEFQVSLSIPHQSKFL